MITIVAHFRTEVVKFIFAGRNSGQKKRNWERSASDRGDGPNKPTMQLWDVA